MFYLLKSIIFSYWDLISKCTFVNRPFSDKTSDKPLYDQWLYETYKHLWFVWIEQLLRSKVGNYYIKKWNLHKKATGLFLLILKFWLVIVKYVSESDSIQWFFKENSSTSIMENIKSTLRSVFSVNKKLLPLKVTLFMFAGAAYAMLPYLTIHMKDIGISDIDVALIYSILPFCVFTAPPLVGFFADKIGNYTRVNMVFIVLTGVFHTALLLVPPTITQVSHPEASINIRWV